jgi:hypothetical protein
MTGISKTDLFAEFEKVLKAGSPERRNEILRRMTALSLPDADRLHEQRTVVLDGAPVRLIGCADLRTPATSSAALADMHFVPKAAVRRPASLAGAG